MDTIVGGPSKEQKATPEVQKICNEVKHEAEKKAGKKFDVFIAKSFTTQVVAGTNYSVKVQVGRDQFIRLRVHKPLPCNGTKLQLLELI